MSFLDFGKDEAGQERSTTWPFCGQHQAFHREQERERGQPAPLRTAKFAQGISQYSFYKACTQYIPVALCTSKLAEEYFPVLLRTTKFAERTSQYYFVLQSLHVQSTFLHYFVLQSLHKAFPSTTSDYKVCTKLFPVLPQNTRLADSTPQYYFVLQSFHKVFPGTTPYYKACTRTKV